MASASILFLRPPPNVEFVQGFPGIPASSPDRQACVRGVVELRPSGSAVKARWVKIELRKVETLPGGGQANTYIDFIGESPVTLWQAPSEWEELRARDFPFQIRIPEAVPPSIALERNAGIKYELVASVLTKGKRGLLRREATPVVSTSCQIIVDKHELHSAWPIYAQPESRSRTVDGYTLTVNRTHTAYGPGDRIAVQTLIKNETMQSNQVRYYEFSLLQHVAYRTSPQAGGKRNGPPPRTTAIQEQRIPITMASPLHPGMQVKAELSLQVPLNHTTTTVSWAQRIEVAFAIHVKGVLTGGQQLQIDLPITMSNWTRAQSLDAVRRIGNVPNLTLQSSPPAMPPVAPMYGQPPAQNPPMQGMGWGSPPAVPDPGRPMSMMPPGARPPNTDFVGGWADPTRPPAATMGGVPTRQDGVGEFGIMSPGGMQRPTTIGGAPAGPTGSMAPGSSYPPESDPSPPALSNVEAASVQAPVGPGRQARRMTATTNPAARFTVVNPTIDFDDLAGGAGAPAGGSSGMRSQYLSADEEKRRVREAMDRVDREGVQNPHLTHSATPPVADSSSAGLSGYPSSSHPTPSTSPQPKPYMSAEDEKRQLAEQRRKFDEARERALRLQSTAEVPEPEERPANHYTTPPPGASGSSSMFPQRQNSAWMSAAEEKERLSYTQAVSAVERTQHAAVGSGLRPGTSGSTWTGDHSMSSDAGGNQGGSSMSAGKALYQSAMASMGSRQPGSAYPGSSAPAQYPTAAEEKEAARFKRAMEAAKHSQMGAAYSTGPAEEAGPVPYEDLFPAAPAPSTVPIAPLNVSRTRSPTDSRYSLANGDAARPLEANRPLNAREEKERMKMLYEQQDASARQPEGPAAAGMPLVPPGPVGTSSSSPPPPLPPANGNRPLTAAEEKAMLRAQYANEDNNRGFNSAPVPAPPPNPYATNGYADHPPPIPNGRSEYANGIHPVSSPPKPLTAAEEKAALKAKYAAEEAPSPGGRGPPPRPPPPRQMSSGPAQYVPATTHTFEVDDLYEASTPRDPGVSLGKQRAATPPPLPTKPPADYYQSAGDTPSASYRQDYFSNGPAPSPRDSGANFIDVRPFSPFSVGFDYGSVPPPPPLPPKPVM